MGINWIRQTFDSSTHLFSVYVIIFSITLYVKEIVLISLMINWCMTIASSLMSPDVSLVLLMFDEVV